MQAQPLPPPTTPHAKIRLAASYARNSGLNADRLVLQHERNRRQAALDGYYIPDELCFEDDSTPGVTTTRRGFDHLMSLVESSVAPFEMVYVRKKARLGRWADPGYHHYIRIHLEKHGVGLRISDGVNPDYDRGMTPEVAVQSMWDHMEGITCSTERTETRNRVQSGIRGYFKRGFWPAGTAPYGTERWLADKYTGALVGRVPTLGEFGIFRGAE
jgi:DNA invertase Pin-like site-specific DNA recombinase